MKFNESPFVDPKKPGRRLVPRFKRFEHRSIKSLLEREFEDPIRLHANAVRFFNLSTTSSQLTEEELGRFSIFARHVGKRILNAQSQKEAGILSRLRLASDQAVPAEGVFPLFFHDISHAFGSVATGRYLLNENSPVPPFFEYKRGYEFNNREVLEDEIYAALFSQLIIDNKRMNYAFFTLAETKGKPCNDFIKTYISGILVAAIAQNNKQIFLYASRQSTDMDVSVLLKEAENLRSAIEKTPPEKAVSLLTRIWNEKNNPRILADIFFEETKEFIDKLQKRKDYRVS